MVELLPVQQRDPQEGKLLGLHDAELLRTAQRVCRGPPERARGIPRAMVEALHTAGIEVILDVVYNHTAEGAYGRSRLTAFGGVDNAAYYAMSDDPRSVYRELYRMWRQHAGLQQHLHVNVDPREPPLLGAEMHVDGFHFDLASVLARGSGRLVRRTTGTSLLAAVRTDPILRPCPSDRRAVGCRLGLSARDQISRPEVVSVERTVP